MMDNQDTNITTQLNEINISDSSSDENANITNQSDCNEKKRKLDHFFIEHCLESRDIVPPKQLFSQSNTKRRMNNDMQLNNNTAPNQDLFSEFYLLLDMFPELQCIVNKELDLGNCDVDDTKLSILIPLLEHMKITKLDLHSNKITMIPETIPNLKDLILLDLSHNRNIRTFPESLTGLEKLEELRMFCCNLTSLSKTIGTLKNLTCLNVSSNQISVLPKTIGMLINLKHLNLYNNNIQELPEEIGNLEQLQSFNLSFNLLKCLPDNIGQLTKLEYLWLQKNNLSDLPIKLKDIASSLMNLNLSFNKFTEEQKNYIREWLKDDNQTELVGPYGLDL